MGVKFVRPISSVPKEVEPYQRLTFVDLKQKVSVVVRDYQQKGVYFITHDILRNVLRMTDEVIYLFEDLYSVNRDLRRINSLDFWCSLVLCSVGENDEKITFCFSQMDGNNDGYLSFNELFVLLTCASRGVARLKGLPLIPLENIDRIINSAFKLSFKTLREGEISLEDFSGYILTDDLCRTYLTALGAKLPPVDAAAIVMKRSNILRELTSLRSRCDEILCEIDEMGGKINYESERGGDSSLLSLQNQTVEGLTQVRYTPTPLPTASSTHRPGHNRQASIPDNNSKFTDIKNAEILDWNHPVNKYFNTDDIWIYQVYDLRNRTRSSTTSAAALTSKSSFPGTESSVLPSNRHLPKGKSFITIVPAVNIYTTAFETSLWKEWEKIPQDTDKLIPLDAFTLMAIFDRVGITITYAEAKDCLETIPQSQLKKYYFQDVLAWLRFHYDSYPILSINPYYTAWKEWIQSLSKSYQWVTSYFQKVGLALQKQRTIVQGVNQETDTYVKKLATIRNQSSRKASIIQLRYNINGVPENNPQEEIQFHLIPENSNQWKTKIKVAWTTNPFTNISTKRSKTNSRIQVVSNADPARTENPPAQESSSLPENASTKTDTKPGTATSSVASSPSKKNETLADLFAITASQEEEEIQRQLAEARKHAKKKRIIKKSSYLSIEDYPNLQASDILDYYNLLNEEEYDKARHPPTQNQSASSFSARPPASQAFQKGPKVYSSVTWFAVELKALLPYAQIILVKESIFQFFHSLPQEYSAAWYEEIKIEICTIGEQGLDAKDYSNSHPTRRKSAMSMVEMMIRSMAKDKFLQEQEDEEKDDYLLQSKVLLVSLLHTRDFFTELEQYLIGTLDLYLSRVIHSGSVEFFFQQGLVDLFQISLSQYNIEQKLFGPQEQELIEKNLINPLSYAKEIRQVKKSYQEIIQVVSGGNNPSGGSGLTAPLTEAPSIEPKKYTKEELIKFCKENGYAASSTHSYAELAQRVQRIYELKLELLNYGELNATSLRYLQEIFHQFHQEVEKNKYSREADQNWKFWEFNEFLYHTGIQTLYQKSEYEAFLREQELYMDADKQMSLASLQAYYEKIGHLYQDLLQWKICNLDHQITGKCTVQVLYDSNALSLLLSSYYDAKPVFLPGLLKELVKLMTIKEYNVDRHVHSLSEIIEDLFPIDRWFAAPASPASASTSFGNESEAAVSLGQQWKQSLLDMFSLPGEFAKKISTLLSYWNHGKEGLLPLLRKYLYEEFILDNQLMIQQLLPKYDPLEPEEGEGSSSIASGSNQSPTGSFRGSVKSNKQTTAVGAGSSHSPTTTRPNSQQAAQRASLSRGSHRSKGSEPIEEPPSTFLDAITQDPKRAPPPPTEGEEMDHTTYYDTEEEEEEETRDIRERIIFDKLFTTYFLQEYSRQLEVAFKEEDQKRIILEEEKALKQAAYEQMEEMIRQEKEKKAQSIEGLQLMKTPAEKKKEEEEAKAQADMIAQLLAQAEAVSSLLTVLTDEEVQEKVSHQVARTFLSMQPNFFRNTTTENGKDPANTVPSATSVPLPAADSSPFMQFFSRNQHWQKIKQQIITDLVFLYQIRGQLSGAIDLTLEESNQIEAKKIQLFQLLQQMTQWEYQHAQQWTKSLIMMYDCLRLFTTDLAHIGFGTKDVCLRAYCNNLLTQNQSNQLLTLLPKGLQELSPVEEYERRKLQRYINRKMKALAAIERERLRRNMTEEEKEQLRYAKLLAQKKQFIEEEKQLFQSALGELLQLRENTIKRKDDVTSTLSLFEEIVQLKESRFPDEFQTQIARNNYGCLLYEFYGLEHPQGEPAQYILQEASEGIVKLGFDDVKVESKEDNAAAGVPVPGPKSVASPQKATIAAGSSSHPDKSQSKTATTQSTTTPDDASTIQSNDEQRSQQSQTQSHSSSAPPTAPPDHPSEETKILFPLNKAIILINYLYTLQKTESFTLLKQSIAIKSFLIRCYQQLSNSEKHKLKNGIISEVESISVFTLPDLMVPKKQINHIIAILEMCQKEYDYQEKQLAMLSNTYQGMSHSMGSSVGQGEGGDDEEGGGDESSVLSDIHSVVKQNNNKKKRKSKGKKKKKSTAIDGGSVRSKQSSVSFDLSAGPGNEADQEEQDDEEGEEEMSIVSDSKKRKIERDLKRAKSMERRKVDAQTRQEISRQRNKLYTLIQTNQISDIFNRKANKMNELEAPKWGNSSKSGKVSSASKDSMEEEEDEENEFLQLAKEMANHTVL